LARPLDPLPHIRPDVTHPSPPRPTRFEHHVRVADTDIDELGHVNNVVYLQWVQDVAAAHWAYAATDEQRATVVWVAVRHEIDYKAPAFADDEVLVRTWVEAWTAVTSDRHTEIVRASDGALLAKARTVWAALDPATKRPRRVGAEVVEGFLER
jgi:acyl-CoA thioester hydrolase